MAQSEAAASNISEFTISELANALKNTLEDQFGYIRVRGEITGYRGPHASGHAYFALKDDSARLDAVVWRTSLQRLRVKPQEGLEVVAAGRLTIYAGKSSYQIIVESLEPAGVGALMALLETRRRQLTLEGLFAQERKRRLPFFPRLIGVVTSTSGSVIHDILHRITDRFPTRVVVWPVKVQGDGAAEEVAAAIRGFNTLPEQFGAELPDVLIVARGGGSLEDLWSFNEEIVVRAAADSAIPVVSAIGHETDWTLLDHVADYRAPTPTAAAEICTPVRSDLVAQVMQLQARTLGAVTRLTGQSSTYTRAAARGLPSPSVFLVLRSQRFDAAAYALKSLSISKLTTNAAKMSRILIELNVASPTRHWAKATELYRNVRVKIVYVSRRQTERSRNTIEAKAISLRIFSGLSFNKRVESFTASRQRWNTRKAEEIRRTTLIRQTLDRSSEVFARAVHNHLVKQAARSSGLFQLFGSVNYKSVLARGFALVFDDRGVPLSNRNDTEGKKRIVVQFADGDVQASLTGRGSGRRSSKRQPPPEQSTLF